MSAWDGAIMNSGNVLDGGISKNSSGTRSASNQTPTSKSTSPVLANSRFRGSSASLTDLNGSDKKPPSAPLAPAKKPGSQPPRSPSPFDFAGGENELEARNDTICPYCHRTYRQPRLLRCLHALCEDCIIAQLERRPDDNLMGGSGARRWNQPGFANRSQDSSSSLQHSSSGDAFHEKKNGSSLMDDMVELEPQLTREHKPPPGVIRCPVCKQDSQVGNDIRFVSNLLLDYVTLNMLDTNAVKNTVVLCESCKGKEHAIARCQDCSKMICKNCVQAHQYMKCFEDHVVVNFDEMPKGIGGDHNETNGECGGGDGQVSRTPAALIHRAINCTAHANEPLRYACATCNTLICNECVVSEHRPNDHHRLHKLDENLDSTLREELKKLLEIAEKKVSVINEAHANLHQRLDGLKTQVDLGREAVQNAFDRFAVILEEHRQKMLQELDDLYSRDERDMNERFRTVANTTEKINDAMRFATRLHQYGNCVEMLLSRDTVTEQLMQLLRSLPANVPAPNLQYMSDDTQFRNALYGACGFFKNEVFAPLSLVVAQSQVANGGRVTSSFAQSGHQTLTRGQNTTAGGGGSANAAMSWMDANPGSVLKPDVYSTGTLLNPADLPRHYQQIIQQVTQQPMPFPQQQQQQQQQQNAVAAAALQQAGLVVQSGLIATPTAGHGQPIPPQFVAPPAANNPSVGAPNMWNSQIMELAEQIRAAGGSGGVSAAALQAVTQQLSNANMAGLLNAQQQQQAAVALATFSGTPATSASTMSASQAGNVSGGRPLVSTSAAHQHVGLFNPAPGAVGSTTSTGLFGGGSTSINTTTRTSVDSSLFQSGASAVGPLPGVRSPEQLAAPLHQRPLMAGPPFPDASLLASLNASNAAGLLQPRALTSLAQPNPSLFDRSSLTSAALASQLTSPMSAMGWPLTSTAGGVAPLMSTDALGRPIGVSQTSPPSTAKSSAMFQPIQPSHSPPHDDHSKAVTPPGTTSDGGYAVGNPPVRVTNNMSQMHIRHRFGTLGPSHGQFNSPHGFCLGFDEEIVVADTNNHRVQIFNKNGQYLKQFGVPGKEDGQLWYPRKVAVQNRENKARFYIVCDRGNERSRMQIFTREGAFWKKIAIRYVDIVAGLAVDHDENVVAVDSVSPTVFKISIETGELIKWFDCSEYMKEPSDIAIQNKELFICDFKGHCVCVFSDDGKFLRRVGSPEITSFPNGIDISDAGDVLIGDSHGNRFHVAIFRRTGEFETEFECPSIKVSRCCGLRITSEGLIVTLAKNNHYALVLNTLYVG